MKKFLAPEVVQTSAMDCGPASLKALLAGHGVPVSYGRLREACQTDVDGTSIDTLEEVAVQLGLDAEQVVIPPDHLLLPEAEALPALVVVRQANGLTHFVVVWRRHGPLVQVMDPAVGRRWMTTKRLLADLYRHQMHVPAADWRVWAGSEDHLRPLRTRLQALGCKAAQARALVGEADGDATWRGLGTLDAAIRLVEGLCAAKAVARGTAAVALLRTTLRRALAVPDGNAVLLIPKAYWAVRPVNPAEDGTPRLVLSGAVLIRVTGQGAPGAASAEGLSPELAAALTEAPARPGHMLWQLLRADGLWLPAILLFALVVAAFGVLVEALLFRGLFDLSRELALPAQRLGAAGLVMAFLLALLLIAWPIAVGVRRLGRHLETRLRLAFLEKIPRLGDRYFQSRPVSDMAERSHSLHILRTLPELAGHFTRAGFELLLITAGIIWLDPSSALLAVLAATTSVVWPLLAQPVLAERDLRFRAHNGALGSFYLDAMLGLVAVRTHGAERAVRGEHEGLLVEWAGAGLRLQRALVATEAVQLFTGFGLAAWLLFDHLQAGGETGAVLLLVYWALGLPVLGQEVALYIRQYPGLRNVTLRLLEPLGALDDTEATSPVGQSGDTLPEARPVPSPRGAAALRLQNVWVRAGGHTILQDLSVDVPAGSHVAIVGSSGAGKSSLVGLLLGWHRPAAGQVLVDGRPLSADRFDAFRRQTAWVDPGVHLWNAPLIDNLQYATGEQVAQPLGQVMEAADLRTVIQRMPDGLQTPLGEGGGRLSGGEGQRVRFGRALYQPHARLAILDEPFRGLDRDKRRALLVRARAHWHDATLLCITHDVADTRTFPRVLVIEDGRIVEDDTPAALLRRSSRYRALIEEELKVRQQLWGHPSWRRLFLKDGHLSEQARTTPPPAAGTLPRYRKLIHIMPPREATVYVPEARDE